MKTTRTILTIAATALALTAGAVVRVPDMEKAPKYNGKAAIKKATRADEETWKSLGTGELRDNIVNSWYSVPTTPVMQVEVQESEQTPGRYRVVNPYHNYPYDLGGGAPTGEAYMVVDASDPEHCYIEPCPTRLIVGYDAYGNLEQMGVWSIADDYYNNMYGDWELADQEGVCGKLENGCITFPPGSILTTLLHAEIEINWDMQWIRSNSDGMWRLRLPNAPKLDVTFEFEGLFDNELTFNVDVEESVDYVSVALLKGEYTASMVEGIINGSIESQDLNTTAQVSFPYEEDGVYTIIGVPYYHNEAVKPSHLTREYAFSETEWKKCGLVHYTEAILSSNEMTEQGALNIDSDDYDVEIEENVANPGLFRLVNPYGPPYVYANEGYDNSRNYYMEIDATDRSSVFIKRMEPIGLSFAWGRNGIESRAYRKMTEGMSIADIKIWEDTHDSPLFGTHKDDKITFPKEALYWIVLDQPTTPTYWANSNGKFCVEFKPGQVIGGKDNTGAVEGIITNDIQGGEAWYTLDGMLLEKAPQGSGIYVKRCGGKSTKVIIK